MKKETKVSYICQVLMDRYKQEFQQSTKDSDYAVIYSIRLDVVTDVLNVFAILKGEKK